MDMVARFRVARAVGGREGMTGMMTAVAAAAREVWVRSDWDLSQEKTVLARPGIVSLKYQISQIVEIQC